MFALNDFVGVGDDAAFLCLPENFFQSHHRHSVAVDQIPQKIAGSHRGQLVAVAHQNDLAA